MRQLLYTPNNRTRSHNRYLHLQNARTQCIIYFRSYPQYTFCFHEPIHRAHTGGEKKLKVGFYFREQKLKVGYFHSRTKKHGSAGPVSIRSCLSIGIEWKWVIQMPYSPCGTISAWDPTRRPLTRAMSMAYRRKNPLKGIASFTNLTFPSIVTRYAFILFLFS